MRILSFVLSTLVTVGLIVALDNKWGSVPPLGKFLSPQQGFWQNAEPVDYNFSEQLSFKNLKGKANVYFDDRLVPHVFAEQEEDAFFIQGYLHAKFRLWQMDFQNRAAAGRLSEVLGNNPALIKYDRQQRRLGMVYGAENALKELSKDPYTRRICDAYTAGVNAYISSLTASSLPLEFKLLDYKPEEWSNLKIALFAKLMTSDLAGQQYARDIAFSNECTVFSPEEMKLLYPEISDSSKPIIPSGSYFDSASVHPVKPSSADSLYFKKDSSLLPVETPRPTDLGGSNNWAVSGSRSRSGAPILCNDPHLRLTLPSIWYEIQLTTPQMNVYGTSFPGGFGVQIGFNDSIAFGVTNAGRDVMDYYRIKFKDPSRQEYWFNNQWRQTELKIESIGVRGGRTLYDTVAYTAFGPVMYDQNFSAGDSTGDENSGLAVHWIAHEPANDFLPWLKLDKAKNYKEYRQAIKSFVAPGQNFLFAAKSGDIAITQQGKFPARWEGQGLYVMPGEDSSYQWQSYIPFEENPHSLNPEQGFLQSANQRAVDSSYPYFIPGDYITARGVSIYNHLTNMWDVTPKEMMALQSDNFSTLAEDAVPLLLKNLDQESLSGKALEFLQEIKNWNYVVSADSKAPTIYQTWLDSLQSLIWSDEFAQLKEPVSLPDEQTLIEILLRDSSLRFVDNINTPAVENLQQQVTAAFKATAIDLSKLNEQDLVWWRHKNSAILHLLRESLLPFGRVGLPLGGWGNTINASTRYKGPSWKMIVHLTTPTEAYGVYPGGQSGNPGSKYYDNFINYWAQGKYYVLWIMKESERNDKRIKWTMSFTNN